jgi:hypothetical protein
MPVIPAMQEVDVGGHGLGPAPRQKQESLSEKYINAKEDWGMAQTVQCLPSKHKALNSKARTTLLLQKALIRPTILKQRHPTV